MKIYWKKIGIDSDKIISVKAITSTVLEYLDKQVAIESKEINYTYEDAKNFIQRLDIDHNIYISKKSIEDLKERLLHGEDIANLPEESMWILNQMEVTEDEIEEIIKTSKENFAFGIIALDLSEDEIVEYAEKFKENWSDKLRDYLVENHKLSIKSLFSLYYEGLIQPEFFKEFSEENDISSEINLQTINGLYRGIKNSEEKNEENIKKLNKQIELYKALNIEGKNKSEIEEQSNNVLYEIAEYFEDDEDILFYYHNGLLTLNTVADWSGEELIEKLYQQSEITFQELEALYSQHKISQPFIEKVILENQKLDYAELMAYIYLGYLSEDKVIDLYMQGRIFDVDLENMTRQGRITVQRYVQAISERTKEKLEENSKIKLELTNIPTKKEIHGIIIEKETDMPTDTSYKVAVGKNKTLIDPMARYQYLDLLGAQEAKAIIPDEDNTFYHYEFFVIPDANGELQANSVVIAERIWEDKEDQSKGLATENATYFFQYKDLMVNSNLSKKEMTKERDKVISTANHRIGSWAVSVLYRIAQTTKSSNLKEYKKGDERATVVIDELLKLYTEDQLGKILKMAGEIDDMQKYILEEVSTGEANDGEVDGGER